jgi:hypothetical protein
MVAVKQANIPISRKKLVEIASPSGNVPVKT